MNSPAANRHRIATSRADKGPRRAMGGRGKGLGVLIERHPAPAQPSGRRAELRTQNRRRGQVVA